METRHSRRRSVARGIPTSASCAVRTASRRPRGRPRRDSQNSRGNATSSAGARRSNRSRTLSADSSTGRSTVGCSGGSESIGGLGEGARRSSYRRRVRPGNLGNDSDQGPSPSQRSRLTDRTSGRRHCDQPTFAARHPGWKPNSSCHPGWKSNSSCGRRSTTVGAEYSFRIRSIAGLHPLP